MIGKQLLALIEQNGVTVTQDITFQTLSNHVKDECARAFLFENDGYADECIPLGSLENKDECPVRMFYERPGLYIYTCFQVLASTPADVLNTESILKNGFSAEQMANLLMYAPGGFFVSVKGCARTYLADTIDGIMREAINDYLDKGEQKWH